MNVAERCVAVRKIDGNRLENLFEFATAVVVEASCDRRSLATLDLGVDDDVIGRGVKNDGQAGVGPEVSLGAETMWRADDGEEARCADRTDAGEGLQEMEGRMFACFAEHGDLGLLTERADGVELRKKELGAFACSGFRNFVEPVSTE